MMQYAHTRLIGQFHLSRLAGCRDVHPGRAGGRGKGLVCCYVDRAFTDDELDALVAWCESVEQAIPRATYAPR